eukprot:2539220-Rhodomonas_salina.2
MQTDPTGRTMYCNTDDGALATVAHAYSTAHAFHQPRRLPPTPLPSPSLSSLPLAPPQCRSFLSLPRFLPPSLPLCVCAQMASSSEMRSILFFEPAHTHSQYPTHHVPTPRIPSQSTTNRMLASHAKSQTV